MTSALSLAEFVAQEEAKQQSQQDQTTNQDKPTDQPQDEPQDDQDATDTQDDQGVPDDQQGDDHGGDQGDNAPSESTNDDQPEGDSCGCQDNRQIIEYIKEQFGEDLSHYKDDKELLQGLVNARRLVGQRQEEAKAFQQLRQVLGDEAIQQLLSGQPLQQQGAPAQPPQEEEEFDESWLSQVAKDEQGRLVAAPGAPPDLPERIIKFFVKRERLLNEFAKNPVNFLAKQLGPEIAALVQQQVQQHVQTTITKAASTANFAQFVQANKELLWENGDHQSGRLTPLGRKITQIADTLQQRGVELEEAVMTAWDLVKDMTPPINPTRPTKPAAQHAPPSTKRKKPKSFDELFSQYIDQGMGLAEALQKAEKEANE